MKYDFTMTMAKLSAEELARRIEEKYAGGWELYAVSYDCASFIRSTPKKITAYVELGGSPDDEKKSLYKDFGWEYVTGSALYSVYINDSDSPYPVHTDLTEAVRSTVQGAYSSIGIFLSFFLCFMLINLGSAFYYFCRQSLGFFASLVIFDIPYLLYSFYYIARIAKASVNAASELSEKCGQSTERLQRFYKLSIILSVCFLIITEVICVWAVCSVLSEII
ncbi:MAG: DUF2812 domain-containing protein [Oscillospiraceae bacterium]|nr:DUF2812 domain-containing protein [Oscillospiraceae bacterium]